MKHLNFLSFGALLCVLFIVGNIYQLRNIIQKNKYLISCFSELNDSRNNIISTKNYFLERNQKCIDSEGLFSMIQLKLKK